jgi:hypothetical protein
MLTQGQQEALNAFSLFLQDPDEPEFILEGFSGSGKTYLTQEMINAVYKLNTFNESVGAKSLPYTLQITATTNKAVTNIAQALTSEGSLVAPCTIQSFMALRVANDFKTGKTKLIKTSSYRILYEYLVFIDEASYIDTDLLKLIRATFSKSKIVYIGDPSQLLAVFETTSPVFNSNAPKATLTEIVRQSVGNPIIELGASFREALTTKKLPVITATKSKIELLSGPEFKDLVTNAFTSTLYKNDPNAFKILAWTNDRVQAYNQYVRSLGNATELYEKGEYMIANSPVIITQMVVASSEKIMRIENAGMLTEEYGVKGQWLSLCLGFRVFVPTNYKDVVNLLKQSAADSKQSGNWQHHFMLKEFFADLRPVHASTVHKSQGSTYGSVFLDLSDICSNNRFDEVARLLYVGSTRAKETLYCYGNIPSKYL